MSESEPQATRDRVRIEKRCEHCGGKTYTGFYTGAPAPFWCPACRKYVHRTKEVRVHV